MVICQNCGEKILSDKWDYCPNCGTETFKPNRAFIYEQLFELMKLQENRRQELDLNAHTYVGLVTIVVTIIVALGGVAIKNITNTQLLMSNNGFKILSVLYFSTVLFFIIGVLFALRARHVGAVMPKILVRLYKTKTKKVYRRLNEDWLVQNSEEGLASLQKKMIGFLGITMSDSKKSNRQKQNNLACAYYSTVTAIFSLLLSCVATILSIYMLYK